ncbi:acetyl-CoA synthetase-like protein [Aspergillus sclerotioniger CBS 115572]|uniref:Acetyl-CoA synthetase-like protein n=1 Tax=Aspergillus sclerotioniger CBS 115572 TaxID=1450535 RepID=A0A317X2W9_9EURO|nr:acetyl-CoA synthetase-like protein [Aspergillus sclerotioniger CBS 115572]PWY92969.1 acetyl-CoA synthetase-like protein [Aspergillus sclerotioniger CBS 115572]
MATTGNVLRKRLLTTEVDAIAEQDPGRRFCVMPKGSELSDGLREVSIQDLARGINFMSWWIDAQAGKGQSSQSTVAYMGANDIRYFIFIIACHKTGYKPLLPSSKNSDEAQLFLLDETKCTRFFYSEERERKAIELQQLRPELDLFQLPSLDAILESEEGLRSYPFTQSYEEAEDEVFLIVHSSGSTGMPKPIPLTHGYFSTLDALAYLPRPGGRRLTIFSDLSPDNLVLSVVPFFHMMGVVAFTESIFHAVPFLYGPEKPLSVDFLTDLIKLGQPSTALLPPSILDDISLSEEALLTLSTLESVYFGGAPLSSETGDKVRKYTKLITALGSTETSIIPSIVPEKDEDYGFLEWNPNYGATMEHVGDGIYELVIPRPPTRDYHGICHTFPSFTEYHTKDLFTQHPTNHQLWKHHGRLDDVIVLSNGFKFNPVIMETMIEAHPRISRALVVGKSKFHTALLVEPYWDPSGSDIDPESFIEEIWPAVETANQAVAAHGRVLKDKIGLSRRDKSFQTTPKGSTRRAAVLRDYAEEIEAIYSRSDEGTVAVAALPETPNPSNLTQYIHELVAKILQWSDFSHQEDLYKIGLDSLQTIQLSKYLRSALLSHRGNAAPINLTTQMVYANPTVERLAQLVLQILDGGNTQEISRPEKLNDLVQKYTADLPFQDLAPVQNGLTPKQKSTVILTGSTGSLGTYLLDVLLQDQTVAKVYCFNRSDAKTKQEKSFEEKGLKHTPSDLGKVEFLTVSFGDAQFGVDPSKYEELLSSVDTIIHNAWKVDFNHSVDSFEDPHIRGVRNFIDFSLQSKHRAHFYFVSSVGTVGAWTSQMGETVPELPIDDSEACPNQGYGESKYISERICYEAAHRSGMPTTVFRVGQIAGPTTAKGQWNPQDWLPTIIATSKAIGLVPDTLGSRVVDWIAVDTLAKIISEIIHTRATESTFPSAVFHLVNPSKTTWESLVPAAQEMYPHMKPVDLSTWVKHFEEVSNPSEQDIAEKPALKLLDFYREFSENTTLLAVPLAVDKAKESSATMASLGAVTRNDMMNWLRQWGF